MIRLGPKSHQGTLPWGWMGGIQCLNFHTEAFQPEGAPVHPNGFVQFPDPEGEPAEILWPAPGIQRSLVT